MSQVTDTKSAKLPDKNKPDQTRWEKTRTHHLILLQSPLWIVPVLYVMHSGILRSWTDVEYLVFSLTIASPAILLPFILSSSPETTPQSGNKPRKYYYPYYLKLNIWIFILVCFGTYFGTHYFFDLMGMRYSFGNACTWHLESDVMGQHRDPRQVVPLFMYPLTYAYFMTYYTLLVELEQLVLLCLSRIGALRSVIGGKFGRGLVVLALSYGLAFTETYIMASPLLEDLFLYEDRGRMLKLGSLGYASYFVVGLPMVKRIDRGEDGGSEKDWSLGRVVIEALGTSMGIMVLLEVWAKVIGPL